MSLFEDYHSSLQKVGDGSVNPEVQKKKRQTYSQMKIVYRFRDFPKPKTTEFRGGMPDSILRIRLSRPFRRILHDPNNFRFWNRIDNMRSKG